jgi:hypothetical protein
MNLEQKQAWMREKQQANASAASSQVPALDFAERHYTVAGIARLWDLSPDFVRKMFTNEPGVVVFGDEPKLGTRRYRTLRIPQSVVARVHRRLTKKEWRKC